MSQAHSGPPVIDRASLGRAIKAVYGDGEVSDHRACMRIILAAGPEKLQRAMAPTSVLARGGTERFALAAFVSLNADSLTAQRPEFAGAVHKAAKQAIFANGNAVIELAAVMQQLVRAEVREHGAKVIMLRLEDALSPTVGAQAAAVLDGLRKWAEQEEFLAALDVITASETLTRSNDGHPHFLAEALAAYGTKRLLEALADGHACVSYVVIHLWDPYMGAPIAPEVIAAARAM